ncbi:MAG: hypothetical protein DRR06_17775 [Gammaproteobacteria bacterium]|nr:MAG: hypothetical protein DRR06_17775 [Gammaproteobacteria bacterium]
MAAAKGNKYSLKLETPEARRKVFIEYCDHVARGRNVHSFPPLALTTIQRYFKDYPEDFIQEEFDCAKRSGEDWFEDIAERAMMGEIPGFNTTVWVFSVKNKYGWHDKQGESSQDGATPTKHEIVFKLDKGDK